MNITFLLFDKKKEKTSLRAFIYHRGEEYRISVGESAITKYWNENKGRCKLIREYPEAGFINKRLDEIEIILANIINAYGLITPTESQIRTDFKAYRNRINVESGGVSVNESEQYFVNFAKKLTSQVNYLKHRYNFKTGNE